MIVITGASGQLGRLIVEGLLKKVPAQQIVAAVRHVEKAADLAARGVQVRLADYDNAATLDAAFAGAQKILLISSSELGQRTRQHDNVVQAAKRAGVKLLAYTSVLRADSSALGLAGEHRDTEAAIVASGLPHVFLRNGWYLENYTGNLAAALEHGAILGSAGGGRIAAASRADYADAAVAVLTAGAAPAQVIELAGDNGFTLAELAAEVARQSRKAVVYKDMPQADYEAFLLGAGLPQGLAALLADSDAAAAGGALDSQDASLSRLIGRPTTTLSQAVAAALAPPGAGAH